VNSKHSGFPDEQGLPCESVSILGTFLVELTPTATPSFVSQCPGALGTLASSLRPACKSEPVLKVCKHTIWHQRELGLQTRYNELNRTDIDTQLTQSTRHKHTRQDTDTHIRHLPQHPHTHHIRYSTHNTPHAHIIYSTHKHTDTHTHTNTHRDRQTHTYIL